MKLRHLLIFSTLLAAPLSSIALNSISPGKAWADTSGTHINAHGGCVVYNEGTYYWFGEDRTGSTSNGISCYSSTDLYNWKRVGLAFKASQAFDAETGKCTLERPKVIYNATTDKWVMYIHWEDGTGYGKARVCVAQADKINGSYTYVDCFRPNNRDSRDQNVAVDSDGKAYHFCATDMNTNINIALLSDDYLSTASPAVETQILKGRRMEAPAVIRVDDTWYGVFSECDGWNPTPGHWATGYNGILQPWVEGRNFAVDNGAETTYKSQSTFIFKVEGYDNAYIYMGDRWVSSDVGGKSEYVWLPLSLRSGQPTVKWYDSWDKSVFNNCDRFKRLDGLVDGAVIRLLDKYSDRWISSKGNGFYIDDDNDATNIDFKLCATDRPYLWQLADPVTGKVLTSQLGAMVYSDAEAGNEMQLWRMELEEDGNYRIQNISDGKYISVSGASQRASSPIFMAKSSETGSQSFSIMFDATKYDYPAAAMFTHAYRASNAEAIAERVKYEYEAGVAAIAASDADVQYFTLQGMAVDAESLAPGIYIRRQGGKTSKVIVK